MGAVALGHDADGILASVCSAVAPSQERCSATLPSEGDFWVVCKGFLPRVWGLVPPPCLVELGLPGGSGLAPRLGFGLED